MFNVDQETERRLQQESLVNLSREIPGGFDQFFPYANRLVEGINAKEDGWQDTVREVLRFVGIEASCFSSTPTSSHVHVILENVVEECSPEVKRFIYGELKKLQPSDDKPYLSSERAELLVMFAVGEEQAGAMVLDNLESEDPQLQKAACRSLYQAVYKMCKIDSASRERIRAYMDPNVVPMLEIIGSSITSDPQIGQLPGSGRNLAINAFTIILNHDPELAIELIVDKFLTEVSISVSVSTGNDHRELGNPLEARPSIQPVWLVDREEGQYTDAAQGALALLTQVFPFRNIGSSYHDRLVQQITRIGEDGSVQMNEVVLDALKIIGVGTVAPILRSTRDCIDYIALSFHLSALAPFGVDSLDPILNFMDEGDYRDMIIGTQALNQFCVIHSFFSNNTEKKEAVLGSIDLERVSITIKRAIGEAESHGDQDLVVKLEELRRVLSC